MPVISAPKAGTSLAEWARAMTAIAGDDHVVSGLQLKVFSGLTVQLTDGQGVVGGMEFSSANSAGSANFTSSFNTSSQRRVDRLVARRLWPSLDVEIAIKEGSPAAAPQLPPLTRNAGGVWEFGLGYWVVPGLTAGGPNIANGKVWGHYADDNGRLSTDSTANIATGRTELILAMADTQFAAQQVAVPGAADVRLDVTVSCKAIDTCAGLLILQMAGRTDSVQWKALQPGNITVTSRLKAKMNPLGGQVPAIVQMSVEGPLDAATPLVVGRISAHQYQVMR